MQQTKRTLSQRLVDAIKPSASEYIIWDNRLSGYGLRVHPSGKAVFIVQWRDMGRDAARAGHATRRITLGPTDNMTETEARKVARRVFQKGYANDRAGNGVDDGTCNGAGDHGAAPASVPFSVFAEEFLTRYRRNWKPSTYQSALYTINGSILPHFGDMTVDRITRADVTRWFAGMADRPGKANRSLPVLSVMMREAEIYGYRAQGSNPCRNMTRYKRVRKERYLNREELVRLGAALDRYDQIMPVPTRLVRALLLTGCRRGEMVNLRWRDVQDGRLSLPDSKTGPKFVHIAPQAQDILQTMPRFCDFVFPNRALDGPISEGDLLNLWSLVRNSADLRNVRLHDLRHTYASIAMRHGIHIVTLSRLLGHADTETTLRYAHFADAGLGRAVRTVSSRIADDLGLREGLGVEDLNAGEAL